MTAQSVPEFEDFASRVGQGNEQKSPGLVLSGAERTREALLAAGIAVEHTRIVGPVDSRRTAAYAASVADNSRRLAGCDAELHLRLLREHVVWLRSLPTGSGELRW